MVYLLWNLINKYKWLSPKLSAVRAKISVTLVQALALQGSEDALDNALSFGNTC
jgi:hypothetical protein